MKFKPLLGTDLSGHLGGVVASHNTYASYFRQRKHPVNRKTAPQQEQRLALQILSSTWRSLDPSAQAAWIAAKLTKKSRSGNVVTLSGQAAWMYVNLLRQRLGLALIPLPPSSSDPVTFTLPTVSFVAPDQLTIGFAANDEWNAPGGGVIVSGSAPLGPGVAYCQSFAFVAKSLNPEAVAQVITYPFAVQGSQTVRVRFHCTGPDGRQTLAVDVNVTLPATATLVDSVQVVTALTALWVFDHVVTADGTKDTYLLVDATAPTATAQAGVNSVLCTYAAGHVVHGKAWSIPTLPDHVVGVPPIEVPQSGLVQ
jgi:hypothetical protein